jgi:ComF family protein
MGFVSVYSCVDRWVGRLLPPRCVLCNRVGAERGFDLCAPCRDDLPWIRHACPRCGLPVAPAEAAAAWADASAAGCTHCRGRALCYTACFAPYSYHFPLARLIQALKYEGALANGRVLGILLARAALDRAGCSASCDAIVPLPLHVDRLVERGYNQSFEIARFVAAELGVPCLPQSLRRVRHTQPQVGLPRGQRLANVQGAFEAQPQDVVGRRLVLLDDVITTGSSVSAAAEALLLAGAACVEAWAVARALG